MVAVFLSTLHFVRSRSGVREYLNENVSSLAIHRAPNVFVQRLFCSKSISDARSATEMSLNTSVWFDIHFRM